MGHDRLFSLPRRLLPEHHVYVRSGRRSRYVVLTWPWQVGVSLALAAVAVWAGLASFGWLAAHLETLDQRRELARVAQANQRLQALAAAYASGETRVQSLVAGLEEVKAGGQRDIGLPDAAAAEAPNGWPEAIDDGRLAERLLPAALQINASGSGRVWLYDRITRSTSQRGPPRQSACATSCASPGPRSPASRPHCGTRRRGADRSRRAAPRARAPGAGARPGTSPTPRPAPCAADRPAPC